MALTKLPRNAIGTGAIDNTKIEDGTIQAVELSGTLPETKLATSTITNAKLSNSTISFRGTSRALGDSFSLQVDVDWQSVQTGDFTAAVGRGYFVNTTSGVITVTLPTSASIGDTIAIKDYAGTFASNNLTIARNGHNIQGVANNSLISTNRASLVLVYVDSTKGWLFTDEHNVADLGVPPEYIVATGGTVTTVDTNFKVHTFTGDGCFVVSSAGFVTPAGGSDSISYIVLAGGGAGARANGGGGGAGGYREGKSTSDSFTSSPLNSSGGILVSTTTYPITVGGGGGSAKGANTATGEDGTANTGGGGAARGGAGGSGIVIIRYKFQ